MKTWLQRLGLFNANDPPCRSSRFGTEQEACRYVDDQLRNGLPPEWTYHKGMPALQWRIEPRELRGNSLDEGYILEVSGDYRFFILYYGNAPAGCHGISHSLWTAAVINSERLADCSLAKAVNHLIAHPDRFPQNIWSLT
jgi:hypothetical protein